VTFLEVYAAAFASSSLLLITLAQLSKITGGADIVLTK
jgi:hypothetical protein